MDNVAAENPSFFSRMKKNPWILSTIVLAVIVVVLFFVKSGSASVSEQEAGSKLVGFLNNQVGGGVTLDSVSKDKGMYKVIVNYQGNAVPLYVTLDGSSFASSLQAFDSQGSAPSEPVDISVGDSPVIGLASAPVTVIEFSDFSCPFCAAASGDNAEMVAYMKQNSPSWEPIVTNMMRDYVETGKVRFAVKYSMGHSGGKPAQLVAWCLNEQNSDLYWKFYPKAFENQDDVEDLDKMKTLGLSVGGNSVQLQSCLDSGRYESRFELEQNEASAAGASGTPAFFVNGRVISGAVPYSEFKAIVEEELSKTA